MTISKICVGTFGTTIIMVGENARILTASVNPYGSLMVSVLHDESGGRTNKLPVFVCEEHTTTYDNPGRFVTEIESQGRSLYIFEATKE